MTIFFFLIFPSNQVHKRMTSEQLRSIFHVESQDLVPHYEVIHLTHHGTTEHKITKRSVDSASSVSHQRNNQFVDAAAQHKLSSHHVKKDLSKSAYYSELKLASKPLPVSSSSPSNEASKSTNSINSELNHSNSNSFSGNSQSKLVKSRISDSEFDKNNEKQFTLPSEYTSTRRDNSDDSDSSEQNNKSKPFADLDLNNIKEHNVSLSVFGEVFNLTLRPTQQLFKNGPQSLQMFAVNASPNETHGLAYEPIQDVSLSIYLLLSIDLSPS